MILRVIPLWQFGKDKSHYVLQQQQLATVNLTTVLFIPSWSNRGKLLILKINSLFPHAKL